MNSKMKKIGLLIGLACTFILFSETSFSDTHDLGTTDSEYVSTSYVQPRQWFPADCGSGDFQSLLPKADRNSIPKWKKFGTLW